MDSHFDEGNRLDQIRPPAFAVSSGKKTKKNKRLVQIKVTFDDKAKVL